MTRSLIFLFAFTFFYASAFSQKVINGVSESKYVNITKDPTKPPYLEIEQKSTEFTDANGNQKIDANETTKIRFKLLNSGSGSGLGLKVITQETSGIAGLNYIKETILGTLEVGNSKDIELPVSGLMNLTDGKAVFSIKIIEANGFGTDPIIFEVPTQAFQAPKLAVVDFKVSSQTASVLLKRQPFDLEVLLQNTGQGDALDVNAIFVMPANVFCLSANETFHTDKLAPGETVVLSYSLVTNNEYTSETLPFTVKVQEKYGKYSENKSILLTMNQPVSDIKISVLGKDEKEKEIIIGSLISSVDKNIPENKVKNPNRIALVIGNENYANSLNSEINVEFARHDADVFRNYALTTMGVQPDNMFFLQDATSGQMHKEIDRVTDLVKLIGKDAELIFYYAGHGLPDEATKIPYLIPVDVDATNLTSAISLSEIYQKFNSTTASRITVFLDACFSGGGRNLGLLAARGARIVPELEMVAGNMVVFSASSAEQSALPYALEKHGMFTYFLLKKLQESSGKVTYDQLNEYLKNSVGQESLRKNSKPQNPEVQISPLIENTWRNWTFK